MAEPPQAGSIARCEGAGGPPEPVRGRWGLFAWLKLEGEPGEIEMLPALRVLLTFVKEVCAKQIEQVPGLGPLLAAFQQMSAELGAMSLPSDC